MVGLKQLIKNQMEDDRSLSGKLIEHLGFEKPALYKFLNNDSKETEFENVLKMVQYLFPDNEFTIMNEYAMTLHPNKDCARQALEYAKINKLDKMFDDLLEILENSSNASSKDIASVYRVDKMAEGGQLKPIEAIEKLDTMKIKNSQEAKVYAYISKFYSYYDLGMIDTMTNLCPIIEDLVNSLDDSYMKKSFYGRLLLLSTEIKLYNNKVNEIRKISDVIGLTNESIQTMLNVHIGNSYMFENFDQANQYLNNALNIALKNKNKNGEIQSKRSLNFLYSFWGKQALYLDEKSDYISDIHEIAFSMIKTNRITEGISILKNINKDQLTDRQKGFHYFYWGMATNDIKYFRLSIKHFNLCNEKFFKTPVLIELKRLGEDESILEVYSV